LFSDASTGGCIATWALNFSTGYYNPAATQTKLTYDSTNKNGLVLSSPAVGTDTLTSVTKGTNNSFKIVGKTVSATPEYAFLIDAANSLSYGTNTTPTNTAVNIYLSFYTNCLKWNPPALPVKSLYAYIDVQYRFIIPTTNVVSKSIRLLKLYPQGGVIQNNSSGSAKIATDGTTPLAPKLHLNINGDSLTNGAYQESVCIVELDKASVARVGSNDSTNVLALWIANLSLVNLDFSNPALTYPSAPLDAATTSYGLQAAAPALSGSNNYLGSYASAAKFTYNEMLKKINNYNHFMGSVVLIKQPSATIANNILIPVLCPGYADNASEISIVGASLTMSNYASVTFTKFFTYGATPSFTEANILTVAKSSNAIASPTASNTPLLVSARFNAFGAAGSDALSIYNYNFGASSAGSASNCSGFSLLLGPNITVGTVSLNINSGTTPTTLGVVKNTSAKYYIQDTLFSSVVLATVASPASIAGANTAFAVYSGLTKPTIAQWSSTGNISGRGLVAFTCASASAATTTNGLTNYNSNYFYLDYTGASTSGLTVTVGAENTDTTYLGEASSVKITVTNTYVVPGGTQIQLTNDGTNLLFAASTSCGVTSTANGVLNACEAPTGTPLVVKCTTTTSAAIYYVYCFNVKTAATATNIASASLVLNLVDPSNSRLNKYISGTASAPSAYTSSPAPAAASSTASISAYSYSYSNQEAGLGKLNLQVNLSRSLVRNAQVVISGLPTTRVTNVTPRCTVSTSTNAFNSAALTSETGDVILQGCAVDIGAGTITITTKDEPLIGGLIFSKNLYISVWPVYTTYGSVIINTGPATLTVTYKSQQGAGTDLIGTSASLAIPTTNLNSVFNSPTQQDNSLCSVAAGINLPGVYNYLNVTVDLSTNKASFNATVFPNEVTLHFPAKYFDSKFDLLSCTYNNNPVGCAFIDDGVLDIKFASTLLTTATTTSANIIISGFRAPEIAATSAYGACAVSFYNINTGYTGNLIVGSVTYPAITNTATTTGNLKLFSYQSTAANAVVAKSTASVDLKVGIDNLNSVTFPVTLTKPTLTVTFPNNYNLALYKVTTPSVTVVKYSGTNTATSSTTAITSGSPITGTVSVLGNMIMFTFAADLTIASTDLFFDILISGVPSPTSAVVTSQFDVTLANTDNSVIYRTASNSYNFVGSALATPIDNLLQYNRGYNIIDAVATTDTTGTQANNWNLNIYSVNGDVNQISVKPGRYAAALFDTSYIPDGFTHTSTVITLPTGTVFGLLKSQYTYATAYLQGLQFYIGTPCATLPGNYIINFATSGGNFNSLAPVQVNVAALTKTSVTFSSPSSVAKGGMAWITFSTAEIPYEALSVNFNNTASTQFTISNSTIPAGKTWGAATYSDTNGTVSTSQTFTVSGLNACFSSAGSVVITPSATLSNITNTTLNVTQFTAVNYTSDNTVAKDAIKISYTPTTANTVIRCALACSNGTVPSDSAVLSANMANNNPSLQYYYDNVVDTTKKTFTFSNLLIGQNYILKCLLTGSFRCYSIKCFICCHH